MSRLNSPNWSPFEAVLMRSGVHRCVNLYYKLDWVAVCYQLGFIGWFYQI